MQMEPELTLCPECRSKSATLPSETLRWVCAVCGAPRIPALARTQEPAEVRAALRMSRQEMAGAGFAKLFGIALTFASLALLGVTAVAWGHAVAFAFLGLSLLSVFATWRAFRRGKLAHARADAELAKAWDLAAGVVVEQSPGSVTPRALAEKLNVAEPEAERILTTLATTDRVRIANEADELAFQSTSLATPITSADLGAPTDARDEHDEQDEHEALARRSQGDG